MLNLLTESLSKERHHEMLKLAAEFHQAAQAIEATRPQGGVHERNGRTASRRVLAASMDWLGERLIRTGTSLRKRSYPAAEILEGDCRQTG